MLLLGLGDLQSISNTSITKMYTSHLCVTGSGNHSSSVAYPSMPRASVGHLRRVVEMACVSHEEYGARERCTEKCRTPTRLHGRPQDGAMPIPTTIPTASSCIHSPSDASLLHSTLAPPLCDDSDILGDTLFSPSVSDLGDGCGRDMGRSTWRRARVATRRRW